VSGRLPVFFSESPGFELRHPARKLGPIFADRPQLQAIRGATAPQVLWRTELSPRDDISGYSRERFGGHDRERGALSLTRRVDKADAPIMPVHGSKVVVVHLELWLLMINRPGDHSLPVETISPDGEDLQPSRAATRKAMLSAAIDPVARRNPTGRMGEAALNQPGMFQRFINRTPGRIGTFDQW